MNMYVLGFLAQLVPDQDFLYWLVTSVATGGSIAILLERYPAFQKLTMQQKLATVIAATFAFPQAVIVVQDTLKGELPVHIDQVIEAVTSGLLAFFASQLTHMIDR